MMPVMPRTLAVDAIHAGGGARRSSTSRGARRAGVALLAVAAAAALAWRQPLADLGARSLDAWLGAQQAMLAATGNLNADGRAEFAVLLHDGATAAAFRDADADLDGVRFARDAALPGWVVIETDAGDRDGLAAVRSLPAARLVVPNRGLWICH